MIRNYLTIAFRNIVRNPLFSFITLFSLALSMAAVIVLFQYIYKEVSFDNFHKDSDQIYRATRYSNWIEGEKFVELHDANIPFWTVNEMMENYGDIDRFVKIASIRWIVQTNELYFIKNSSGERDTFKEPNGIIADSSLFQVFNFPIIASNGKTPLSQLMELSISESLAKKYFGDENPIGQELRIFSTDGNYTEPVVVGSVFADIPENSTLQFDYIIPYVQLESMFQEDWYNERWPWGDVYFKFRSGVDVADFHDKSWEYINEMHKESVGQLDNDEHYSEIVYTPLAEMHFLSVHNDNPWVKTSSKTIIYALTVLGLLLFSMGGINYMNLVTAMAVRRAREVGIRKTVGARSGNLMGQFIMESFVNNAIAVVFALFIAQAGIEILNYFQVFDMSNIFNISYQVWIILILIFLIGALVSSYYPALVVSRQPIKTIFLTHIPKVSKGLMTRKVLLSFQFFFSIILAIGALISYRQINTMLDHDMGFDKENILAIQIPPKGIWEGEEAVRLKPRFQDLVRSIANVNEVTGSVSVPGPKGAHINKTVSVENSEPRLLDGSGGVDFNFPEFYNLQFIAGRTFRNTEADRSNIILSRLATERLGFSDPEDALNKTAMVHMGDTAIAAKVIGIIEDYALTSLHQQQEYRGIVLTVEQYFGWPPPEIVSLKIAGTDYESIIDQIRDAFFEVFPNNYFDYFFVDEQFGRMYAEDLKLRNIILGLTLISILISAMGLFGLVSIMVDQKIKEIGIRKVMGASMTQLIVLLIKPFLILLAISSIFSVPIIYFAAREWLANYSVQVSLSIVIFVLPILAVFMITVLTMIGKVVHTANINPVKSLRYE